MSVIRIEATETFNDALRFLRIRRERPVVPNLARADDDAVASRHHVDALSLESDHVVDLRLRFEQVELALHGDQLFVDGKNARAESRTVEHQWFGQGRDRVARFELAMDDLAPIAQKVFPNGLKKRRRVEAHPMNDHHLAVTP